MSWKTLMPVTDKKVQLEKIMVEELYYQFLRLKDKWDCVFICDGDVGVGKTEHALQICYFMNHLIQKIGKRKRNFNIDNVVFSAKQFETAVTTLPEMNVILWDESSLGAGTADSMSAFQKTLRKYMDTIRYRRYFIVLVLPEVFDLQKKFIKRSQMLVHHYSPDNLNRGFYNLYDKVKLRMLYREGKRNNDTYVIGASIKNLTFNRQPKDRRIIPDVDYTAKKTIAVNEMGNLDQEDMSLSDKKTKQAEQRNSLLHYIRERLKPKSNVKFKQWLNRNVKGAKWSDSVTKWADYAKEELGVNK